MLLMVVLDRQKTVLEPRIKLKVLLIDDEKFARDVLKRMIKSIENIEILETGDSYEGLLLYEEYKPDVLITDILMEGGISGEWLITKILNKYPKANIVVVSGVEESKLMKYKLMGVKECFKKPVKYYDFISCLETLKGDIERE